MFSKLHSFTQWILNELHGFLLAHISHISLATDILLLYKFHPFVKSQWHGIQNYKISIISYESHFIVINQQLSGETNGDVDENIHVLWEKCLM